MQQTESRKIKRKLNILIVDDNPGDIELVTAQIEDSTWIGQIFSAKKLQKAVELCAEKDVDVVLLDLGLPDSSGIDTFIKFNGTHPELAVMVMTGLDDERTAIQALQAGAQDYLVKGKVDDKLLIRSIRYAYERKEIEDQLENERNKIREYFDLAGVIFLVLDHEGKVSLINQAGCEMLGYKQEEVINSNWVENFIPETLREKVTNVFKNIVNCSDNKYQRVESLVLCCDGKILDIDWHNTLIYDDNGKISGTLSVGHDITEKKKTEADLIAREGELRKSQNIAKLGLWQIDLNVGKVIVSEETQRIYGLDESWWSWEQNGKQLVLPEYKQLIDDALRDLIENGKPYDIEFEIQRKNDGQIVYIHSIAEYSKEKNTVTGVLQDITERKNAEKEKEQLEEQFRQTQKMESIGRLAGGVAHDFNNMLCVMLGHGEYMMNQLGKDDPLYKAAEQIVDAAKRSADLTRQLLAFSRKQTLSLKVINLNKIINGVDKMLRRLIGEDIEFKLSLAKKISSVKADPGQVEQVIMNLVVNARDAMMTGGKLEILTEDVEITTKTQCGNCSPGKYVCIAVKDNGVGMDEETQLQIFEPFYTTKEKGKGTGLGLSTVYGIMRQSNGCIAVDSEVGRGTTFKIYLPVTEAEPGKEASASKEKVKGQGQLIMVVEDEPALRDLLQVLFEEDLGYKVETAANGGEALLMVEEAGVLPDLLITDIVMPGMNGRVLAERLLKIHPEMKVLFMSGYTQENLSERDKQFPFIPKPFNISEISGKVQEILSS